MLAQAYTEPPSRHEADELVAATTAVALESDVLAICNPYPGDALSLEVYGDLVTNARAAGMPGHRRSLEPQDRGGRRGRARPGQAE